MDVVGGFGGVCSRPDLALLCWSPDDVSFYGVASPRYSSPNIADVKKTFILKVFEGGTLVKGKVRCGM